MPGATAFWLCRKPCIPATARLSQSRKSWHGKSGHAPINTYTKIVKVSGADWLPDYNAKGLSKKVDKTSGMIKGYRYSYDAWDRLVEVKGTDGSRALHRPRL